MGESILRDKSFAFAVSILGLGDRLMEKKEYSMKDQIVRSGTSIGANIHEGIQAQSKSDFVSKYSIALKEASETSYWLVVLHRSEYLDDKLYLSLKQDVDELIRLLVSSIKTVRKGME